MPNSNVLYLSNKFVIVCSSKTPSTLSYSTTTKLNVVIQYTNRVALQIRMYTHLKINCINNGHCVLTHKTQFLSRVGRVTPVRLGLAGWVTCEEGVETSLPAVGAEVSCRRLLKLLSNDTSDISCLHFYICCTNCG